VVTLRAKTLVILTATLAGLLLIMYLSLRFILLESFIALEQQSIQQNVERAINALSDDITTLDRTTLDYASWDDTYAFMADGNQEYLENYVDTTFSSNRLNLVLIVNNDGQSIFAKAFDLNAQRAIAPPQRLLKLQANDRLLRHSDAQGSTSGVIMLPEGPMLVAARPILTSTYAGPLRGTLIMGRALDAAEIQRLADTTRLSLSVYSLDDPQIPDDIRSARERLAQDGSIEVRPLSEQTIVGYTVIKDVYGNPAIVAQVQSARSIYQQGQTSIRYFALLLLVAGIVFGIVVLALLEWAVLSRMARLEGDARHIGASGDQSARVSVEGADELARLASGVNGMLDALERAQQDRRKADEERARFQEELIRAREQMVQMAVHDLKNPLTAIAGFLQALRATSLRSEQLELAEGASGSVASMSSLVETFLDVAQMQEGRLSIHTDSCDIVALFKGCIRELSLWAEQDQKQIAIAVSEPFPSLIVDSGLMRRVILNLLSNAIKHTPTRTSITLGADVADGYARLWVQDTGQGISPDLQNRLFERFSIDNQPQQRQTSTGLGLAFCKLAAEAHGGTIELNSGPGQGTKFTVVLPLQGSPSPTVD
jgi:signal transduction histidine kinase